METNTSRHPILFLGVILGVIIAVGLAAQSKASTESENLFTDVTMNGIKLADCSTCIPSIEVTEKVENGVLFVEYVQNPEVYMASHNFFRIEPGTTWCVEGDSHVLLKDTFTHIRIDGFECGYTNSRIGAMWLDYFPHVYLSNAPTHELKKAIGHPEAIDRIS